eukprot:CAMPEP_0171663116 /NCGR_PEP_ID=MMETSP0990-20121206/45984_1 /TAXON_ID=483369 /ORGANISM="non described non described, Strain CCMP2098" /LENGTH=199 /DNA_ID=CAMNT_0012245717 /DNA_START=38 /DNA_END=638 /DNA_ORIENTATION=+
MLTTDVCSVHRMAGLKSQHGCSTKPVLFFQLEMGHIKIERVSTPPGGPLALKRQKFIRECRVPVFFAIFYVRYEVVESLENNPLRAPSAARAFLHPRQQQAQIHQTCAATFAVRRNINMFCRNATGVLGVAGRFDDGEESPIGGEQEKHKFSLNVTLGVGVWELGLDIVPEEPTLVSLSGALAAPLRLVSSANQSPDAA